MLLHDDAFAQTIGPLIQPGYQLALAMLGDRGLAEDAVQEAALAAWRKLPAMRDRSALRPWFLAIVANQCRSLRRGRWWRVLKVPDVRADRQSTVTEELAVRSLDIERGLGRLGDLDRLALYLHFYLDLPYEDVGRVMGLTMTAARSRIHRATKRLRPEVELQEVFADA